jgi:LysR family hca operon transcriptional activator
MLGRYEIFWQEPGMSSLIELRHLRYFVAVAEEMNITRAAHKLHTAQPSLSRQVRQLEEMIRAPLLLRQGHHVELTAAGRSLLTEARRLLQDLESTIEATRQIASSESGSITVAFFPGSDGKVFSRITTFVSFKSGGLKLILRSLRSAEQIEALQKRAIHAGFLRGPIDDPEIAWRVLRSDTLVVVLPAGHPLAKLKKIPLAKLAGIPLVELSRTGPRRFLEAISAIAYEQGIVFQTGLKTDNMLETLAAVGAGLGFSFLPDYIVQMAPRTVITRPLAGDSIPKVDLLLAYRRDNKTPQLAKFLELVDECFAKDSN